jgi:hypothetical protein
MPGKTGYERDAFGRLTLPRTDEGKDHGHDRAKCLHCCLLFLFQETKADANALHPELQATG